MALDRVVLAVECGACQQITAVPTYDGVLHIARCGSCGRAFQPVEELMDQYQTSAQRIAEYDVLRKALHEARQAMTTALAQWGRKAGKEALSEALSVE
jgi:hypothetical protein